MFCQRCGTQLNNEDKFCGNCGAPINGVITNEAKPARTTNEDFLNKLKDVTYSDSGIVNILKTYIKNPVTVFKDFKDKESLGASLGLAALIPIIYGIFSILYFSEFINGIIKLIQSSPKKMAEMGIITLKEATEAMIELQTDKSFITLTTQIKNFIDKADIFKYSALFLLILIAVTVGIIALVNLIALNSKLSFKSIIFLATVSSLPIIAAFVVQLIVGLISLNLSIIFIPLGYILSIITLYQGLCEYSSENSNKIFTLLGVVILVIALIFVLLTNIVSNIYFKDLVTKRLFKEIINGSFF